MRIIAGKFKGRSLESVPDISVRPATGRVKGAIFNMLQNRLGLINATVLDLFAGSGSLGFEALSRGASAVVFVDESRPVLESIRSNAQTLGCLDMCDIIHDDAVSFVGHCRDRFDLIFADPPYAYAETPMLPMVVFQHKLLKSGGFLIIEHAKQTTFSPSEYYKLAVQKQFGNTQVSFFQHHE
jgi:16S rRNA (guanine(966)-N(2))-methyltransferase RsmD